MKIKIEIENRKEFLNFSEEYLKILSELKIATEHLDIFFKRGDFNGYLMKCKPIGKTRIKECEGCEISDKHYNEKECYKVRWCASLKGFCTCEIIGEKWRLEEQTEYPVHH